MSRGLAVLLATGWITGCGVSEGDRATTPVSAAGKSGAASRPWIDTHSHPLGVSSECTSAACVEAAVATMDSHTVRKAIWMSPPSTDTRGDESAIRAAVQLRPDRLLLGMGGTQVNSRIQQTPDSGSVTDAQVLELQGEVQSIVAGGGVVVLGEIAALHLSYQSVHPFEETPASTRLFLALADQAAAHGVAIDLHMDAVSSTTATPQFFLRASPNNPAQLAENVSALETLLAYNRGARIVWAHVGRDTTGQMSADLVRRLLAAHPNLYAQIAPTSGPLGSATAIIDGTGAIRPEWLAVLQAYPERFVLGSDTFYTGTAQDGATLDLVGRFLEGLPQDLASQLGCTNPVAVYRLSSGC